MQLHSGNWDKSCQATRDKRQATGDDCHLLLSFGQGAWGKEARHHPHVAVAHFIWAMQHLAPTGRESNASQLKWELDLELVLELELNSLSRSHFINFNLKQQGVKLMPSWGRSSSRRQLNDSCHLEPRCCCWCYCSCCWPMPSWRAFICRSQQRSQRRCRRHNWQLRHLRLAGCLALQLFESKFHFFIWFRFVSFRIVSPLAAILSLLSFGVKDTHVDLSLSVRLAQHATVRSPPLPSLSLFLALSPVFRHFHFILSVKRTNFNLFNDSTTAFQ